MLAAGDVPHDAERVDPRIRRTRQLLHDGLQQLLEAKSFEKISVGEITRQANVNRATFYDHYPDKLALLEGLVSSQFQELLDRRQVVFDGKCSGALLAITTAMCDYLSGLPGGDCAEHRRLEMHFESALMTVVRKMILGGMAKHSPPASAAGSPELIAATISGAIYGGVSEWARNPNRVPVEQAASSIAALILPMLPSH